MAEKAPRPNKMPDEVFSVLYDAATAEDRLRDLGYHPKRIATIIHKPLNRMLIDLRLQKIDTRLAFPPEDQSVTGVNEEIELTPAEDRLVNQIMDTEGLGYIDAVKKARARLGD